MNPLTAEGADNVFRPFSSFFFFCSLHALLLFLNNFSISEFTLKIPSLLPLEYSWFILTIHFALNYLVVVLHLYLLRLFS